MGKCAVQICSVTHKRSFFQFPVGDLNRCKKWLIAVGRKDLWTLPIQKLKSLKVCEMHFSSDSINYFLKKSTLSKEAIPSTFLPPPLEEVIWPMENISNSNDHVIDVSRESSLPYRGKRTAESCVTPPSSKVMVMDIQRNSSSNDVRFPESKYAKSATVVVDIEDNITYIYDEEHSQAGEASRSFSDPFMSKGVVVDCFDGDFSEKGTENQSFVQSVFSDHEVQYCADPDHVDLHEKGHDYDSILPGNEDQCFVQSVISDENISYCADAEIFDHHETDGEEVFLSDVEHCDKEDNIERIVDEMKSSKGKRQRSCSVVDCANDSDLWFRFPSVVEKWNLTRCREWIKKSGNSELLTVPTISLHKNHYMCGKHFEADSFANSKKKLLRVDAIPTLSCPSILTEEELKCFPVLDVNQVLFGDYPSSNCDFLDEHSDFCDVDRHVCAFENDMKNLEWYSCERCNETFLSKKKLKIGCLHNNTCLNYGLENNMDPGPVPEELEGLSLVEEQLIARINPIVSVYQVKGQQYKYSGNVINFPQKVEELAVQLPRKLSELTSTMTVRLKKKESDVAKESSLPSFIDFHVRADRVRKALVWLQMNNPFYSDIEISEENITALPEDGNIYETLSCIESSESSVPEVDIETNRNEMCFEEDESEMMLGGDTGLTLMVPIHQDDQINNVLKWPKIEETPVNEFQTSGYIAMAFPTLYPTGAADLNSPRNKKISNAAYFQHLLRYKDGRFSKHPRFRYFALNSLMRWTAINDGNIYVKKHDELKGMSVEDLKAKVKENPNILRKVMFHCTNLRSTKPYWKARTSELINMIEQLGMPTLFLTLSAADFHWPDLFRILAPGEDVNDISDTRRRKLVVENPMVVDKFFSERVESYLQKVIIPKFKVTDYWYRVEYQHRGSPHIHGVMWVDGAPDVSNLKTASPEERENVAQYFDKLISAVNPNEGAAPAIDHPCRRRFHDVIGYENDLAELLNKVQKHTICREGYCLRKNKKTGMLKCRFDFPKDTSDVSKIKVDEDGINFIERRDDRYLNKYNEYLIRSWRANMDISAVLSKQALICYLAKYVSKSESKSRQLQEVLSSVLDRSDDNKQAKSVIQKLFIETCAERDYSAQEVMHLLLGEKLYSSGGRHFININFGSMNEWEALESDNLKYGKSIVEKYCERPEKFKNVCLWEMAKHYHLPSGRKRSRGKAAIVQVFPNPEKIKAFNVDEYYKIKVLLYVPWQCISDFNTQDFSWEQIYLNHLDIIRQSDVALKFPDLDPEQDDGVDDDDEELNSVDDDMFPLEWMEVSKMGPTQEVNPIQLGLREVDLQYDWNSGFNKYNRNGSVKYLTTFIKEAKQSGNVSDLEDNEAFVNVQLTPEQNVVISLVKEQIQVLKENVNQFNELPKKVIVQGKAGTGKSVLISVISSMVKKEFAPDSVLYLLAPTGVAALNVKGKTIHSQLHISRSLDEFEPLKDVAGREFGNKMKKIKFLIIDEYSMVGCNMLGMIDRRCRQGTGIDEDFGGINVYFFGDINQLPPVLDTPLYSPKTPQHPLGVHGKAVFHRFEKCIILSQVHRQNDENFKKILDHVCGGEVNNHDFKILSGRFQGNLSPGERKLFNDAITLYPTKEEVMQKNFQSISALTCPISKKPVPIARIAAQHFGSPAAAKGSVDDAGGLFPVLHLGVGARVMCRSNLYTEQGLVNGSIGVVKDIVYDKDGASIGDLPIAIICSFDTYKGPYLNDDYEQKLVPIPTTRNKWTNKAKESCGREQFPLTLAYALSIHKAQGLTLSRAIINIGRRREIAAGITYVALSRVKSLDGLMLLPFDLSRFMKINQSYALRHKRKCLEQFQSIIL